MRDLNSIYAKLLQVLYPLKGGGNNQLLRFVLLSPIEDWILSFDLQRICLVCGELIEDLRIETGTYGDHLSSAYPSPLFSPSM